MELTRGERLQIMLTEEELKALDDWRFARRMPSRAAAVRELLKRGLAAEGVVMADGHTKSQDFGVTDGSAKSKRNGDGKASNGDGRSSAEQQ
jgi:hypothetical protein